MRGGDERTGELFSDVDLEARVRRDHPLRVIRPIVDEAGIGVDDAAWDHSVFSKNRDRLLAGETSRRSSWSRCWPGPR